MHAIGVVFPGQGSQYVGMGREICGESGTARLVFEEARDVLEQDVAQLCFEGPREALDLTVNTQACLLTVETAIFRVLSERTGITPRAMAGHSLGEYSALVAAGALPFADALKLVRARAACQQGAVPPGEGCMAAIMGLDGETVGRACREISREGAVVELANINCPGQFVISGHTPAVEAALVKLRDMGAKRSIRLPVSIPSHCSLMRPAAVEFEHYLENVSFADCSVPVIPNCDPGRSHAQATSKDLLSRQLYSPVRWQETVEAMAERGIDTIIEAGPKRVLCGLVARIHDSIGTLNVEDAGSLEKTAGTLGGGA